jgi:hypothetical protein
MASVATVASTSTVASGFSCGSCTDGVVTSKCKSAWWGDCIRANTGTNKEKHPFLCAFGCGHAYTASAANSSRVAGHVVGDDDNIKKCSKATLVDKQLANSKRNMPKTVKPRPTNGKRARVEGALGLDDSAIVDLDLDDRPEIAARAEDMREAGLKGYFKKMMTKEESNELDMAWTKAFFMNCIPPNVLDQDDFRNAIMLTSMATTHYTPPRRNVMERRLLPLYDVKLLGEIDALILGVECGVLIFDGWDSLKQDNIVNYIYATERASVFIDDEDLTGKPKDAVAMADIAIKYLLILQKRFGHHDGHPTTLGACTDNPTVMRACRSLIKEKALAHEELYQPYLFLWPCSLHALSSLAGDFQSLPFVKAILTKHKWIVRRFRRKAWLHSQLFLAQKTHRELFLGPNGNFKAITVKRHGETRIGSVPLSMERNIKLKSVRCLAPDQPAPRRAALTTLHPPPRALRSAWTPPALPGAGDGCLASGVRSQDECLERAQPCRPRRCRRRRRIGRNPDPRARGRGRRRVRLRRRRCCCCGDGAGGRRRRRRRAVNAQEDDGRVAGRGAQAEGHHPQRRLLGGLVGGARALLAAALLPQGGRRVQQVGDGLDLADDVLAPEEDEG